jgi:hypothetical protein
VLGCFVVEVDNSQVPADPSADNADSAGLLVIKPAR